MKTDRFDTLTTALARGLTRRHGLGLLAALGAAAALAPVTDARKHKKGRKERRKKPCGGACGECQACISGVCNLAADETSCSGGTCFSGKCLRCPSGKVPVEGRCATPCGKFTGCAAEAQCSRLQSDPEATYCVVPEPFDIAPGCTANTSLACGAGRLCMSIAMTPKCLVAA